MSYNPHPSSYFPNCVIDNNGIFIPYSNLESYNINSSGDISQLAYSLLDAISTPLLEISIVDRPTNITVSRSFQAASDTVLKKTYVYGFNLSFSGVSVTAE